MKKIIICSLACVGIIATSTFNSCKKATTPENITSIKTPKQTRTGVSVNNGILQFATVEDYKNTLTALHAGTNADRITWRTSFTGYQSLADKYLEMDVNAEAEISESADAAITNNTIINVPDDIFASVINAQGLIIFGGKIYKVNSNNSWEVPLSAMAANGVIDWTNKVVRTVVRSVMLPNSRFFDKDDNNTLWPKSNNKVVRFVHTKWCYAIPFVYGSIGTKIRMERKGTFGWVNINYATAQFAPYGAGFTESFPWIPNFSFTVNHPNSGISTNNNVLQRVISWAASPIVSYNFDIGLFRTNAFISYAGKSKNHDWID
jgi:hypothetical protein